MTGENRGQAATTALVEWGPLLFRGIVAVLLVPAGATKLLNYGSSASQFAELGIPVAGVMVLFVGVVELLGGALVGMGVAGRLSAVAVLPIMVVAIALTGPHVSSVAVVLGCLGIAVAGTGKLSLGEPSDQVATYLAGKLTSG
ncbi:DoxX family protein [Haloarcula sp. S1CR25-12]|uniref:DoxX family protein n=1 Tax=Haloarcula saliterrae TaxID=2950534 RepID=A0ABU2F8G1_9EURY|nr:DoxX family protein [Haloarcula sp. S1CR25-12]MDS0258035.1 DoxX family protein [Haloarcula sp. S1CR25-12]